MRPIHATLLVLTVIAMTMGSWGAVARAQAVQEALPPDLPPLPALPSAPPVAAPVPKPPAPPVQMKMEALPAATATLPETPALPKKEPVPAAPVVPVAKLPVLPPGTPNPPPATPTFVPAAAKPGTMEAIKDLVVNPEKIPEALGKLPQQVGDLKSVERDIRRAVSGPSGPPGGFDGEDFSKLSFPQSLMFSEPELKRLYDAVKGIAPPGEQGGPVMVEVKTPKVAPAFYLNSVLYESPTNWTIWLNARRIRRGAKFPELEIAGVREDRVEFIWQTDSLDFISPDWDKKIVPIPPRPGASLGRWAYVSQGGNIFVDQSRRYVRFFLGPHQTFVSRTMELVEGKVNSTFFDIIRQQPAQGGRPAPAGAMPPGARPPVGGAQRPMPVVPASGGGAVQGTVPGAAPGSPMGPARMPSAPATSLNPMAMPSVINTPPGAAPAPVIPTPTPTPQGGQ